MIITACAAVASACLQAEPSALGGMQATVAYFLMADNRRRMPSSAYLRAELTEAHQAHQGYPPGAPLLCCPLCCAALACVPCLCIVDSPPEAMAQWQVSRGLSDACMQKAQLVMSIATTRRQNDSHSCMSGDRGVCSLQA